MDLNFLAYSTCITINNYILWDKVYKFAKQLLIINYNTHVTM